MAPSDSHESANFSGSTENGLSDAEYKHDDILGGRYRVISLLGRGGMGVVYKVEQIFLGKELALKTIDRHLMSDITVRRFKAEARAAFAVDHPNIVSVHDFGLFEDETPFLVMEIVQGETLSDRLKRGTLSVEEAIPIYIQVCFGLAHAHESGVVHRDIKPSNIMLLTDVPEGIETGVKILDFGIAKLAQSEGGEVQALTRTGEIFGSPLYMSPEQCSGGKVDHRADVYSLGCVIFESMTGTPPFIGENALLTMMMHQTAPIPTLKEGSLGAEFPPELERVVSLMLAKNPDDRYQNLGEAAHDLAALKRGEKLQLSPTLKPKSSSRNTQVGVLKLDKHSFYKSMFALAFTTFAISSGLTYVTHANQIAVQRHEIVSRVQPVPADPKIMKEEESAIFKKDIANSANVFESKYLASDSNMNFFEKYTLAQTINIEGCSITDSGIAFLKDSKILVLSLSRCNIDKVDNIAKLKYLQNLDLTKTQVDDGAIPLLAKLKMLRSLSLKNCNITENGLRKICPSTSLISIELTAKKYSPQIIDELYEKMPQCLIVPYRNASKVTDIHNANKKKDHAATVQKILAVAEKANKNSSLVADCLSELSAIRLGQGRISESRAFADRAAAHLEHIGDLQKLVPALSVQATFAALDGDKKRALALNDRAARLLIDTESHSNNKNFLLKLNMYTLIPIQFGVFDPAIKYYKIADDFISNKRYTGLDDKTWLPICLEKIGWLYSMEGKPNLARPYFKRAVENTQPYKDTDPKPYLRALIEYSNTLDADRYLRKTQYIECIKALEKLGLPEDLNLKDHYCDACISVAQMLASESDHDGAAQYLRKALGVVGQFAYKDVNNRRTNLSKSLVAELQAAGRNAEAKIEAANSRVKL
ncbi:hypothetical protein BH10CYA1_BH10CYA1_29210 [soil metagenome]